MKLTKGLRLELTITDLAFGGRGVAAVKNEVNQEKKDFIIFVDGALPGQTVIAKIINKKRRYAEAKMVEVLTPSPDEIKNEFQATPGAPWLCLPVKIQQQYKRAQVFELFKKFANLDASKVFDSFISSPKELYYRNKMDYSFGPTTESYVEEPGNRGPDDIYKKWSHAGFGLGSKKRGQFWLVETLEKPSGMFDESFEILLPELRALCEAQNPTVYNSRSNEGFWRQLVVKKSFAEDKFLLNIITNISDTKDADMQRLVDFFNTKLPNRIKGIYWTQSDDTGNANYKYKQRDLVYGEEKLTEHLSCHSKFNLESTTNEDLDCNGSQVKPGMTRDLLFNISMDSFFQTNIFSAEKLYKKVAEYCTPPRNTNPSSPLYAAAHKYQEGSSGEILELFAGTGTISQILARQNPQAQITSVEIVPAAIKDAKINAANNDITNINFVCDDVTKFMRDFRIRTPNSQDSLSSNSVPQIVVLDPPRAGISPKALQKIIDFGPVEIIYVSCNAATLTRDTATLTGSGYALKKLTLVDQFPHTAHVECVTKFVKNKKL